MPYSFQLDYSIKVKHKPGVDFENYGLFSKYIDLKNIYGSLARGTWSISIVRLGFDEYYFHRPPTTAFLSCLRFFCVISDNCRYFFRIDILYNYFRLMFSGFGIFDSIQIFIEFFYHFWDIRHGCDQFSSCSLFEPFVDAH